MPTDKGLQSTQSPATILIVDDNKEVVDILTHLLSRHGMTPLPAYSGRECLDIVQTRPVDVIILDVMMPGMDGLEVCEELRRRSSSIPVILLTAKDHNETRLEGMRLGVSEFLTKPVNNRDLLDRVRTQIETRKWEKDMERWEKDIDRTSATTESSPPKKG